MRNRRNQSTRAHVRHPDHIRLAVWILWLVGFSESQIGKAVSLTKGQISGLVNSSGYRNRSAMGDDKRQEAYVALLSKRYDENGQPIDQGLLRNLPEHVLKLRRK